jgi:hypothetical protein
MKKLLLIVGSLIILTACQNTKNSTDETWESFEEKYRTEGSTLNMEQKLISLKEYNFMIPNVYGEELIKDSKNMAKNLYSSEQIEIQNDPVSTMLFGGTYDKKNQVFIAMLYLFNNTDKDITDITFKYNIDLTDIKGKNEGSFQYIYSRINEEPLPAKTICPIFLGIKDVKLRSKEDFYKAKELSIEINNILVYYVDDFTDSTQ